jgi:uncharacterized protein
VKIHLETGEGRYSIRRYAHGEVVVNDTIYTGSLIVTPREVVAGWPPRGFSDLTAAHFEAVIRLQPEIVLLGTGARLRFPAPAVLAGLMRERIGYEVMDTGAACRTYNILMAEGRRVAAALLMIETGTAAASQPE